MQRNDEHRNDDLIDLGAATRETKGKLIGLDDHDNGLQSSVGLTED